MRRVPFMAPGALALAAASWGVDFAIQDGPAPSPFKECGDFAVVEIQGPLMQRGAWPWDSYEQIRARVVAALASSLPAVLLRIDSPGGEVAGCFELVEELRTKAAAAGKPVVAYVDGMAASAAYALACAAERIYIPPTGAAGSIGCIKVAVDQTRMDRAIGVSFSVVSSGKRKADGNPHVPMSEEALDAMQGEVDAMASVFFELVGRARGLGPERVAALEAGMFLGASAVAAGLADEVMTFDGLIAMGATTARTTAQKGAEAAMDEKEKAIAALKALAESKDEAESKAAKAALKAMGVAEGEEEKKDDDEEKTESKAEGDDDEKKEEKKDDEGEAKAKVAASADPGLALAAKVQSLEAWKADREEAEERAKLMASRPDFAPEVVALMQRSPLKVVRDAVKNLPRGVTPGAKGGQLAAARAAIGAKATLGETHGAPANAQSDEDARALDIQMGLARRTQAIRHEGNRLILGVMTPAEARAELAKKGAAK